MNEEEATFLFVAEGAGLVALAASSALSSIHSGSVLE